MSCKAGRFGVDRRFIIIIIIHLLITFVYNTTHKDFYARLKGAHMLFPLIMFDNMS